MSFTTFPRVPREGFSPSGKVIVPKERKRTCERYASRASCASSCSSTESVPSTQCAASAHCRASMHARAAACGQRQAAPVHRPVSRRQREAQSILHFAAPSRCAARRGVPTACGIAARCPLRARGWHRGRGEGWALALEAWRCHSRAQSRRSEARTPSTPRTAAPQRPPCASHPPAPLAAATGRAELRARTRRGSVWRPGWAPSLECARSGASDSVRRATPTWSSKLAARSACLWYVPTPTSRRKLHPTCFRPLLPA